MRTKEIVGAILALTFFLGLAPSVLTDIPDTPFEVGGHVYSDATSVSGAAVTVTNLNTSESLTTTTDSNGAYVVALGNLASGHIAGNIIEVTATYSGMSGISRAPRSKSLSDSPQIIDVTIVEAFAITSGPHATDITANTATIEWTTNMIGNSSTVKYGLNASHMDESVSNQTPVRNHSIKLSGLNLGTVYYYNVSSTNAEGTTVSSSDNFTTTQILNVNIAANSTETYNSTSNETTVKIAANIDINGTINITEYDFPVNDSNQVPLNKPTFSVSTGERPVGRYVVIDNSSEINETSVSWIIIKMCYNETALTEAGLDKDEVGIAWYNDSLGKWEMLETGTPLWVNEAPIHQGETCVAANISHFSIFAVTAAILYVPPGDGDGDDDDDGGSSGGGSSGTSSGEPYDNIEKREGRDQYLYVNREVTYSFVTPELAIYEIIISSKKNTNLITARIELLKGTSTLVDIPPEGTVYKNTNIWLGTYGFATSENIKDAAIRFKVKKSWLTDNKLSKNDISLAKWESGNWIKLSTTVLKDDSGYVYYEAHTTSFSPFAIVGEFVPPVDGEKPDGEKPPTVEEPPADGVPPVDGEKPPVKKPWWKIPGFTSAFAIAGLFAVAYAMMRRRRK
ncbi:MAG: hypothetical protein AEth_01487 [Candidatus Argoarchaeum ethanivorans]|uniref:Fibronectin type-III domain-containing protein n=1 Tax=Candidatus Argoarchaeum ethanivorans TaxID=2608793 RepID=A0A8B3S0X1_9EURY|nr:MAG: hypothetical protein AEth_01487 [Candidatus Argoarchaeum ethanivorans]